MNKDQRDYLERYMKENNVEDTTNKIRDVKQSIELRENMKQMCILRMKHKKDKDFMKACDKECIYMKTYQDKLYTKLLNNPSVETMDIANKMLILLEQIEMGTIDQNEGSFEFGKLCKKIYVDPTINEMSNDKMREISWDEYKRKNS